MQNCQIPSTHTFTKLDTPLSNKVGILGLMQIGQMFLSLPLPLLTS